MRKFALLLVALCLVVGLSGMAAAQGQISCSLYDPLEVRYVTQAELPPGQVHFYAYLNGEQVFAGASGEASGSLYWIDVNEAFDEWRVRIDPVPGWLSFPGEGNPSNFRPDETSYFRWDIDAIWP